MFSICERLETNRQLMTCTRNKNRKKAMYILRTVQSNHAFRYLQYVWTCFCAIYMCVWMLLLWSGNSSVYTNYINKSLTTKKLFVNKYKSNCCTKNTYACHVFACFVQQMVDFNSISSCLVAGANRWRCHAVSNPPQLAHYSTYVVGRQAETVQRDLCLVIAVIMRPTRRETGTWALLHTG